MEEKNNTNKSEIALREEAVLAFWRENKTFEKSLAKESPKGNYVFYDGPPFATGQMHYGHILGSTAKDVIGRYQTMRGYHVPRKWGWDCHGLPIENIVEKELGIAGHKEIEKYGIEKFVEYARSKVLQYEDDWESGVERIGRWVDFRGGYKTMDNSFIESVWWALSEFYKKGLVYEGVRVLAYCARCETPIANSEIAMDNSYKDISDLSVYVKFELVDEPNTYLLAWTTTPWTLPGNTAIAINKDIVYGTYKISYEDGKEENLIIAKDLVEKVLKDKKIYLPRIGPKRSLTLCRVRSLSRDLKKGVYNIREPRASCEKRPASQMDIIIIPGVAFDKKGGRLGRGGGYYDRLLRKAKKVVKIGLCFREQIVKKVPMKAHDVRMDRVITN